MKLTRCFQGVTIWCLGPCPLGKLKKSAGLDSQFTCLQLDICSEYPASRPENEDDPLASTCVADKIHLPRLINNLYRAIRHALDSNLG